MRFLEERRNYNIVYIATLIKISYKPRIYHKVRIDDLEKAMGILYDKPLY